MRTYKTALALAEKLVSLPSYVSDGQDETPMTDFLAAFLRDTFPKMVVEKQYLNDSRRCNLILRGRGEPKLFVLGHVDTVQPKEGWQTDALIPVIRDGNLYGLGAADMKGSLAAFLFALMQERGNVTLDNLTLLMYVDEEYDFKGIKRFLADDSSGISPALTLSLDGELAVATGCRGLIELNLTIKGESGHAANPSNGTNAITGGVAALQRVSQELAGFTESNLGQTTTNIASIQGGVLQNADGKMTWLRDGNIIPDTAEVVFEVRPAADEVNAEFVLQKIAQAMKQQDLALVESSIRHDIAPWPVRYDEQVLTALKRCYAEANVPFKLSDRKLQGYIDAQMVAEKIPAPTFIIGTGGENKHGINENVSLQSIEQAMLLYRTILRETLSGKPEEKP